jgi:hypothetical protein
MFRQCSRSMTFWYGSGCGPASDPALFVSYLQDANKNKIFSQFLCVFLFESYVHLHYSLKIKIHKETKNSKKSRFFIILLLVDGRIWSRIRTNILRYRTEAKKSTDPYTAGK